MPEVGVCGLRRSGSRSETGRPRPSRSNSWTGWEAADQQDVAASKFDLSRLLTAVDEEQRNLYHRYPIVRF